MVAVYRGNVNTHQYYHGDRTTEALVKFIEGLRSQPDHEEVLKSLGQKTKTISNQQHAGPEGCLIQGFVMVNKVPGSLSIAAHSKHHTIAASLINTTHKIHHFSFGTLHICCCCCCCCGDSVSPKKACLFISDTRAFFSSSSSCAGDVPPKRSYGILKGAYDAANK